MPVVGRDLEERIDPPAGVAMQVFDLGDFHDVTSRALAIMHLPSGVLKPSGHRDRG